VDRAENGRQEKGRWPEAHSTSQRCLRVATICEFLSEAEQQEGCRPEQGKFDQSLPMQCHTLEEAAPNSLSRMIMSDDAANPR